MKKIVFIIGMGLATLNLTSCRDAALEPTLEQEKSLDESLITLKDLETYMGGVYNIMKDASYLGREYIIYNEVRSDNTFANGNSNRFTIEAEMKYAPTQGSMPATWYRIYQVIGRANLAINKYEKIGNWKSFAEDSDNIKYLVGQAYIIRAMAHFDLVRIFGQHYVDNGGEMNGLGVPYVTIFKGDPKNPYPARNTVQEVYDFAKKDIERAIELMNTSLDTKPNYYMSSFGGWALLSRMATYFNDTPTALMASKKVIDSGKYSVISKDAFVNSWKSQVSSNWIFSLYSNTSTESLGNNALAFIYRLPENGSGYGDIVGLGNLYDIFTKGDIRIDEKMASSKTGDGKGEFRNIGKFPDTQFGGDAIPLLRYEEVILNYAEALLKSGKSAEALTYLNMIPKNRGANLYTEANMSNILLERRKEFAFEGMRFHDLVRTKQGVPLLDKTRQRMKGNIPYGNEFLAFPIPNTEMGANSNMKQNKGY